MSLRMFNGLTARIAQVIADFYPAELALIDTEEGGTATVAVQSADIHQWDRPLIARFPAITIVPGRITPMEIKPRGFGDRVHGDYLVDVRLHVQIESGADVALTLQNLVFRHGAALVRVLCDQKDGLETAADPVRNVQRVKLRAEVDWGVPAAQGTGQQTRTVTVPLAVEKTEAR